MQNLPIFLLLTFLTYLTCIEIEIFRVSPRSGPMTGGTVISVWGTGFTGGEVGTVCYWQGVGGDFGKSSDITANINSTYIECELPAVYDVDNFLQISTNRINLDIEFYISRNGTLSSQLSFTFFNLSKLAITDMTPLDGLYSQTHSITFSAMNLNYTQELACLVEGVAYPVTSIYISLIYNVTCDLPPVLTPRRVPVHLSLNGDHTGIISPTRDTSLNFTFYESAPIVTIRYSPSLTRLYLDFDRAVEIGGRDEFNTSYSPDCTQLFSSDSLDKLGQDALCNWDNYQERRLVIALTRQSSLRGISSLFFSSLQPIRSRYVPYSYLITGSSPITIDSTDTPIPVLYTYTHIPSCGNLTFNALSSQMGGTQPYSVSWSVSASDNQITNLNPEFASQLGLQWSISTTLFDLGVTYTIRLSLSNFLQNSATRAISLIKSQTGLPPATIYHPPPTNTHSHYTIISVVELSYCSPYTPSPLIFSWSISNPVTVLTNTDRPVLFIPANSLLSSTQYHIQYNLSNGSLSRHYEFDITVPSSPPVALILGGNTRTHNVRENLIVDGSASFDPSLLPLTYTWTCTEVVTNLVCRDKNGFILLNPRNLASYNFDHDLLKPSLLLFTLTVSTSDARTSNTAQFTVDIRTSTSDLLYIQPFPPSPRPIDSHLPIAVTGWMRTQYPQAQLSITSLRDISVSGMYYDYALNLSVTPLLFTSQSLYHLTPDSPLLTTSHIQQFSLAIPYQQLRPGQRYRLSATLTADGVSTASAGVDIQMDTLPHFGGVTATNYTREGVRIYSLRASKWRDSASSLPLQYRFGISYRSSIHWLTPSTTLTQIDTPLLCSISADLPLLLEVENTHGSRAHYHSMVAITAHDDVIGAVEKVKHKLVYGHNVLSGLSIVSTILYYYKTEMMEIPPHISTTLWSYFRSAYWNMLPREISFSRHTLFLLAEFISQAEQITDQEVGELLEVLDHALESVNTCPPLHKPNERGISTQLLSSALTAIAKLNTSSLPTWHKLPLVLTRLAYATRNGLHPDIVSLSSGDISLKVSHTSPTSLYYGACNARERDCSNSYPQFLFSQQTFDSYNQWDCSSTSCYNRFDTVQCSGVIIITSRISNSSYHFPTQFSPQVLSDIVSISLLHPDQFQELAVGEISLSLSLQTHLYLPQHYSCAIWNDSTWNVSVCSTLLSTVNTVTCQCQTLGTVAIVSTCPPGVHGSQCVEVCPYGLWGDECRQSCNCSLHSTCAASDGSCDCYPGYVGASCDEECAPWSYGKGCMECGCIRERSIGCDHVNGTCDCQPGFRGDDDCAITCSRGTWGHRCANSCVCKSTGSCNPINGTCVCDAGYSGVDCGTRCPDWTFGSNCIGECTCHRDNTAYCRVTDGACVCNGTYTDVNCTTLLIVQVEVDSFPVVPIAAGAGIVVLLALLIPVVLAIILCCWYKKKRRREFMIAPDKVPLYLRPESGPVSNRMSPESPVLLDHDGFVSTKVSSYIAIPLRSSDSTLEEEEDCWYFIEVVIGGDRDSWRPPSRGEMPFQAPERPEIGVLSLSGRYSEDSKYDSTFERFPEPVFLPRADNTLFELRNAFIDSDQWAGGPFQFLKKDIAFTFIPFSDEYDYSLSQLPDTNVYIQQVKDSDSCMLELCVCGKMSESECSHCGARGYCGEKCQTDDWENHLPMCLKAQDPETDPNISLNVTMVASFEGSLFADSVPHPEHKLGLSTKLEQIGESEFEEAGRINTTPILVHTHMRREISSPEPEELPLTKSEKELLNVRPDTDEVVVFDPYEEKRRRYLIEKGGNIPGSAPDL